MEQKSPRIILAVDVPGRYTGGYAVEGYRDSILAGDIIFGKNTAEADDYRRLARLLDSFEPDVLIIEHAFLFAIAGYVGALKAMAAERDIPWWQVGASKAKKLVLNKGNSTKQEVLDWAQKVMGQPLTQHQADSVLYIHAWHKQHD